MLKEREMEKRNPEIDKRCRRIKNGRKGEGPVVYWMSRDQRIRDNWALLWAQQEAVIRGKGLVVVFCLISDYLNASNQHYCFMQQSLEKLGQSLKEHNTTFLIFPEPPEEVIPRFVKQVGAHLLVCDFDPLRIKKMWQKKVQRKIAVPFFEIDTHNIVPVWLASEKREYGAYTIRPKINRLLYDFLTDIPNFQYHPITWKVTEKIKEQFSIASGLNFYKTTTSILPGEKKAYEAASDFVLNRLHNYSLLRNDPCEDAQSGLSPYLHFGHLSAQRLALMVSEAKLPEQSKNDFLEELIIRKELADNYCYYEKNYDCFSAFPDWAKKTLNEHRKDVRTHIYSFEEFERGLTHESLWNACQIDLVQSAKLHGYLRMYWAKKIFEWTPDPETALEYTIRLNDQYSLDGRDPNGYTGIAWTIGGVHDRAWKERPVFGKIRYMNEAGCRRKFDVNKYISAVFSKNINWREKNENFRIFQ